MPCLSNCPPLEQLQFKQMVCGNLFHKKKKETSEISRFNVYDSLQKFIAIFFRRTDRQINENKNIGFTSVLSPLCFRLTELVKRKLHCGFIKKSVKQKKYKF